MTLDIIIPQYNEPESVIKDLLDSINAQIDKDLFNFQVLIINDGSKTWLSKNFLSQYSFKLRYIKRPHLGVSATRQYGLDISKADFVMFCDADDVFCSQTAFFLLFKALSSDIDVITSPLYMANELGKIDILDPRTYDGALNGVIHGRVYNRTFLKLHNITWEQELSLNEDLYFNTCVSIFHPNICYLDQGFYFWRFNKNSVTQSNQYGTKNFSANFKFFNMTIDKLLMAHEKLEVGKQLVTICHTIYNFIHYKLAEENTPKIEAEFKKFIAKYGQLYLSFSYKERADNIRIKIVNFNNNQNLSDAEVQEIDDWVVNQIKAD